MKYRTVRVYEGYSREEHQRKKITGYILRHPDDSNDTLYSSFCGPDRDLVVREVCKRLKAGWVIESINYEEPAASDGQQRPE